MDSSAEFLSPTLCGSRRVSIGSVPLRSVPPSPLGSILESPKTKDEALATQTTGAQEGSTVKSVWDADEDEFDRWPREKDLEVTMKSVTLQRGTFGDITRSELKTHVPKPQSKPNSNLETKEEDIDCIRPIRGATLTQQQHDDFVHELSDMNCGNADGINAYDKTIKQFYQDGCTALPISNPAGHPHLIAHKVFFANKDALVEHARPRLVDTVATVLYNTDSSLMDFMDPDVKTFEWRRSGKCVMIRREGNEVIVGTFHNYGTCYVWTYFVRSEILETGAWREVYAGASQVVTPVSARGVEFDKLVAESIENDVNPKDEKFALYIGRFLGLLLLDWSVWDFRTSRRWSVEWEIDGVVTNAKESSNEAL